MIRRIRFVAVPVEPGHQSQGSILQIHLKQQEEENTKSKTPSISNLLAGIKWGTAEKLNNLPPPKPVEAGAAPNPPAEGAAPKPVVAAPPPKPVV